MSRMATDVDPMQIDIRYQPSYSLAIVRLDPNESVQAEAGAMVSMSSNVEIETSMKGWGNPGEPPEGRLRQLPKGAGNSSPGVDASQEPGRVGSPRYRSATCSA